MTKQEAIIKAYGDQWIAIDTDIQERIIMADGFTYELVPHWFRLPKTFKGESWRPASIKGIEDNNGWIKIESEADLPKDLIECYVYDDDGDVGYYTFGLNNEEADYIKENGITHYQPIIKPNPPVY